MSDEFGEEEEVEELGEQTPKPIAIPGEGGDVTQLELLQPQEEIKLRKLTFEEASKCLSMLGKDETGARYAYLKMTVTNRQLIDVSIVIKFRHILFLDLSNNFLELDGLQIVTELPFLVYLKASKNKINSAALRRMPYLQVLILGENSILDTADIDQPILETLDLSRNQIFNVEFDHLHLNELKLLDLHGNHLEDISGTFPTSIEKLFLAENNIRKFNAHDLAQLHNLRWLHLRNNKIRKLDGFIEQLANLSYLNLRGNNIRKFRQFRKLSCLRNLDTLMVLENPVAGETLGAMKGEGKDERIQGEDPGEGFGELADICVMPLLVLLPNLKRINKHVVTFEDRDTADQIREKRMMEIMSEESSDEEADYMATTTDFTDESGVTRTDEEESEEDEETADEDDVRENEMKYEATKNERVILSSITDDT